MSPKYVTRSLGLHLSLAMMFSACNGVEPGVPNDVIQSPPGQDGQPPCGAILAEADLDPAKETVVEVRGATPLSGAKVAIPAGAVAKRTHIKLAVGSNISTKFERLGPSLCVLLDDVRLLSPLSVILPFSRQQLGGRTPNEVVIGAQRAGEESGDPVPTMTVVDDKNGLVSIDIQDPQLRVQALAYGNANIPSTQVDTLFLIDNSGSMTNKQKELARQFINYFERIINPTSKYMAGCLEYRVGVITSDVGNSAANVGQDGLLQTTFCDPLTQPACKCPMGTPPLTKSKPYIDNASGAAAVDQFGCITLVGNRGSGDEAPMESLSRFIAREKAALPADQFFRKNGLSVFAIITDEDDCSIDNAMRADFFKPSISCTDPDKAECYSSGFRCLGVGLSCQESLLTVGPKTQCREKKTNTLLKPTLDYATEIVSYLRGFKMGGDPTTMLMRRLGPVASKCGDSVREVGMGIPEWKIAFLHPDNDSPPSDTLGDKAFCSDPTTLMSPEPILGHPSLRFDNLFEEIDYLIGPPATIAVPQLSTSSLCDATERSQFLNGLADDIASRFMTCVRPLI